MLRLIQNIPTRLLHVLVAWFLNLETNGPSQVVRWVCHPCSLTCLRQVEVVVKSIQNHIKKNLPKHGSFQNPLNSKWLHLNYLLGTKTSLVPKKKARHSLKKKTSFWKTQTKHKNKATKKTLLSSDGPIQGRSVWSFKEKFDLGPVARFCKTPCVLWFGFLGGPGGPRKGREMCRWVILGRVVICWFTSCTHTHIYIYMYTYIYISWI